MYGTYILVCKEVVLLVGLLSELLLMRIPLLTDISGWTYSKNRNGRWKRITFADGRTLEVSEQEAEAENSGN